MFRTRFTGGARIATAAARIVSGAFFVLAGVGEFAIHDLEQAEFVRYGLPDNRLSAMAHPENLTAGPDPRQETPRR